MRPVQRQERDALTAKQHADSLRYTGAPIRLKPLTAAVRSTLARRRLGK